MDALRFTGSDSLTLDVSLRTEAAKRGRIVRDWRLGQLDSEMQRWPNHPSPLHIS